MPVEPRKFGKYLIHEEVGRGGFGTVFRATDTALDLEIALKLLDTHLAARDPALVQGFVREGRVAARLTHPSIVRVYDVGDLDGVRFIAMQYLRGGSLAEMIGREAPMTAARVVELLRPIAEALDFAHDQGFVHRDVKPSNIIFDRAGRPVLVDFGLVRAAEGTAYLSLSGRVPGTVQYAAPEQLSALRAREIGPATDVYALGIVAYQMLTGQVPFDGDTTAVIGSQLHDPPPAPTSLNPAIPETVEKAVLQALAKAPRQRPARAVTFVESLAQPAAPAVIPVLQEATAAISPPLVFAELPPVAPAVPPVLWEPQAAAPPAPVFFTSPPTRRERSSPAWALIGIGALTVTLLVLGVGALGRSENPTPTVVAGKPTTVFATATAAPATNTPPPPIATAASPTDTPLPATTVRTVEPTATLAPTHTDTPMPRPSFTPTSAPTPTRTPLLDAVVNSATVNLRAGPGEVYVVVGRYAQGTALRVVGKEPQGKWLQVRPPDGKTGWMSAALLRVNIDVRGVAVVVAPPTPTPNPAPSGGTTRTRPADGAVMVYVPAGEFTMGSADSDMQAESDEKPQHRVNVAGFWIDRTEVTNGQYRKFVEAGGYNQQQYWTEAGWAWKGQENATQPNCWGDGNLNQAQQPVVCVSWYEAYAYARWAGGRLPTEAEWEKAARGTDGRIYPWGNTWDGTRVNFCDKNCPYNHKDAAVDDGYQYTASVGSYANGVSPYGVYDLAGNVWEWVSSEYGSYPYKSNDGREGQSSTDVRVLRGGSWLDLAGSVRSANRNRVVPDHRDFNVGFRVASSGS